MSAGSASDESEGSQPGEAGPPPGTLRWDLAVRIVLAVVLPMLGYAGASGAVSDMFLATVLGAVLVSFGTFGPEFTQWRFVAVTAIGVPVAAVAGVAVSQSGIGGALLVLVLFAAYGVAIQAGMAAQLAWFPVAAAGMLAALLFTDGSGVWRIMGAAAGGSVLAVLLIALVPRVLHFPRLPVPAGALAVDGDLLRRMVRHPSWRDWGFPLLLGGLAAALLVVAAVLTGGFKPYWAVFAFVTVLAPSKAKTRRSAGETMLAAVLGVGLSALILRSGLAIPAQAGIMVGLGLLGAVILLRNGLLSKILLTPLPVVAAGWALDVGGDLALQLRLAEYVAGALLGLVAAAVADLLVSRLQQQRPTAAQDPVG